MEPKKSDLGTKGIITENCPICESPLQIADNNGYCENQDCKGWFCFYCDKWHRWGTFCSVASVKWDEICCQEDFDKWLIEHKEVLIEMLMRITMREKGDGRERAELETADVFKTKADEIWCNVSEFATKLVLKKVKRENSEVEN